MEERPWLRQYDPGVPTHVDYPKVTLVQLLEETARKYPNQPCAIFKGGVVTYAEMNALSDRMAGALAAMGVKRGDPVGIFMPNSPQFVIAFFGILKAGGAVVATNPLYTPREIEHQMKDAGCEIMLVMSNFYAKTKEVQSRTRLKTLVVSNIKEYLPPLLRTLFTLAKEKKDGHRVTLGAGDVWFQDLLAKYKPQDRPKLNLTHEDLAIFQYSGGTTGISKAAVSTHYNLVVNGMQIRSWMPDIREGQETVLMAIPLFHVYGMVAGMTFAIVAGSSMVMIPNPRDLKDVLHNIDRYHPSIFPGVPTMYNAINNHPEVIAGKHDLRSIKACISGSAPLMRDTKERFEIDHRGKAGGGVRAVGGADGHALQSALQQGAADRVHRAAAARCRLPDHLAG